MRAEVLVGTVCEYRRLRGREEILVSQGERLTYWWSKRRGTDGAIEAGDLCPMPLVGLVKRTTSMLESPPATTFRLLKVHGSTNWFFAGDDAVAGQQVYYAPTRTGAEAEHVGRTGTILARNRLDLVPLIIPPVADKASFYSTALVKLMWRLLREALEGADEVYTVGYSLPKTDLTMEMFLRAFTKTESRIFVVNEPPDERQEAALLDRCAQVFRKERLDVRYVGPKAVERMAEDLWSTLPSGSSAGQGG